MTSRPVIRLSDPVATEFERLRIRLAGEFNKIPSNPTVIKVLVEVANIHYDETRDILAQEIGKELIPWNS